MSTSPEKKTEKNRAGSKGWLRIENRGEMFVRVSSLYPYSSDLPVFRILLRLHPAYSQSTAAFSEFLRAATFERSYRSQFQPCFRQQ